MKRVKGIIILALAFLAVGLGIEQGDELVGAFGNVRGFSNLTRTSECSTYVIPEAASASIDWANGCIQLLIRQVSQPVTITSFSNGARHGQMALVVLASTSSPGAITWPADVKWASSSQTAPTLSGANLVDVIRFYSVASDSYYGFYQAGAGKGAPQ